MMLNIIDLVLGIFLGLFLFKNVGSLGKTAKSLAIVALILIAFGVLAQLLIGLSWTEKIQPTVKESFLFNVSHNLIRLVYPAIENTAPQVDSFIKDKIISQPNAKIEAPNGVVPLMDGPSIVIDKNSLPKLKGNELPKL